MKNWIKLTKILIKGPHQQKCADLCDITKGTDSRPKSVTMTSFGSTLSDRRMIDCPHSKWVPTKHLL